MNNFCTNKETDQIFFGGLILQSFLPNQLIHTYYSITLLIEKYFKQILEYITLRSLCL